MFSIPPANKPASGAAWADRGGSLAAKIGGLNAASIGVVLDGQLTVELDGKTHTLKAGDLISYDSARNHRIWNRGSRKARALWVNLRRP